MALDVVSVTFQLSMTISDNLFFSIDQAGPQAQLLNPVNDEEHKEKENTATPSQQEQKSGRGEFTASCHYYHIGGSFSLALCIYLYPFSLVVRQG